MTQALLASEYAHGPTVVLTLAVCALVAAVVNRWWALLLPLALLVGTLIAALSSWYYDRVPEDVQIGVALGALCGALVGAVALLVRPGITRWRSGRGHSSS